MNACSLYTQKKKKKVWWERKEHAFTPPPACPVRQVRLFPQPLSHFHMNRFLRENGKSVYTQKAVRITARGQSQLSERKTATAEPLVYSTRYEVLHTRRHSISLNPRETTLRQHQSHSKVRKGDSERLSSLSRHRTEGQSQAGRALPSGS